MFGEPDPESRLSRLNFVLDPTIVNGRKEGLSLKTTEHHDRHHRSATSDEERFGMVRQIDNWYGRQKEPRPSGRPRLSTHGTEVTTCLLVVGVIPPPVTLTVTTTYAWGAVGTLATSSRAGSGDGADGLLVGLRDDLGWEVEVLLLEKKGQQDGDVGLWSVS
jgi:hypothetical protein